MQIDGKQFIRELMVNGSLSIYDAYFCAEYVSATVLWRDSERSAKHIGYLTCLNHPSRDGTNPHWTMIIQINKSDAERMKHVSLRAFIDVLAKHTLLKPPVWAELRECSTQAHEAFGDLWSDD